MKIFKVIMLFATAVLIFCSCEYEWITPEKQPIPDNVSFSNNIMPIFNDGCNTNVCHGTGATPPDLTDANAYNALINGGYVDTDNPEASILYVTMNSGSMQTYTNPGDEDWVLAWIQQGAKNN